jgi:hypothetical protein
MPMFCFGQFFWFFESDNFFADIAHFKLLRKETCFSKFFLKKNRDITKICHQKNHYVACSSAYTYI